jgi:tetratricopeptide (TPR) repeat protein
MVADDIIRPTRRAPVALALGAALGVAAMLASGSYLRARLDARWLRNATVRDLELRLEGAPADADARGELGRRLLAAGRPDEAARQFQQQLAYSNDPAACVSYADALRQQGRVAEAMTALEFATRRFPDSPIPPRAAGEALLASGSYQAAMERFAAALGRRPEDPSSLLGMARACELAQQPSRASAWYGRLLHRDPDSVPGWIGRGRLALSLGDLPQARDALNRALRIEPTNPEALFWLGEWWSRQPSDERTVAAAEEAYRAAISQAPRATPPRLSLARLLLRDRRLPEAVAVATESAAGDPRSEEVPALLADIYTRQGRTARAAEQRRIQAELARYHQERAHLETLLGTSPNNVDLHLRLARLLRRFGDRLGAAQEYTRVLQLHPGHRAAGRELQSIQSPA